MHYWMHAPGVLILTVKPEFEYMLLSADVILAFKSVALLLYFLKKYMFNLLLFMYKGREILET